MIEQEEINKQLKNTTKFLHILSENTQDYKGKYGEVIINAPKIYKLLCKLLESENIYKKDRHKISSTIAYFILPKDIYPEEEFGAKGYIDDIYLCLYILNEIKEKYGMKEILHYWDSEPELLLKLLEEDYRKLDEKLKHILQEMLDYVGIHE